VDSKFGQLCYPLTIREVWAASLDSCKCGQQVVWAASLDSCKCGQQVWKAVLSIDTYNPCCKLIVNGSSPSLVVHMVVIVYFKCP
jgi:hypothetical protein